MLSQESPWIPPVRVHSLEEFDALFSESGRFQRDLSDLLTTGARTVNANQLGIGTGVISRPLKEALKGIAKDKSYYSCV